MNQNQSHSTSISNFPPVVSVLGHVDHGKTSLLDAIRKTDVAGGEHGGITQKIGTSEIEIEHEGKLRRITFIDTPGHEAFFTMRSQGVNASDIALLIVAADDGIKPQTKESIEKIKEAKIPFIVVLTKIDLPGAQIEKVKQMVMGEGILLEGLGGETPWIGVSSKTGEHVKDLLDLILLVHDLANIQKDDKASFMGVVIDSKLDKRRGAVSTIIVKQGKISVSGKLYREEKELGKIRALFDSDGKQVKEAGPGQGVEILGLSAVLPTGSVLFDSPQKKVEVVQERKIMPTSSVDLHAFFASQEEEGLLVYIKTETSGEMDAIKASLPKDIKVVGEGQGEIGVKDILQAKDFHALVLGFNVGIAKDAAALAMTESVFYKTYTIIYKLLEEMSEALASLSAEEEVKIRGKAEIIAEFPTAVGKILGVRVAEGRLALNDPIIVTREDLEVGNARITLLKRGKAEVKEVAKGMECGVTISPFVDFQVGDVLLSCSEKNK
ncbi:MAG: translation initiation factor IF-2 [Candidatus Levyibacteriota bacterium]